MPRVHTSMKVPGVTVMLHRFDGPLSPGMVTLDYRLWQLLDGANESRHEGRTVHCAPGRVQMYSPGDYVHATRRLTESTLDVGIGIDAAVMATAARNVRSGADLPARFARLQSRAPRTAELSRRLAESVVHDGSRLEQETLLDELVAHALTNETEDADERSPADLRERRYSLLVRDYLLERLSESVTLDDVASETGVTRHFLARRFKLDFGLPPHAFLLRARISHAQRLLREGLPTAAVAAASGFADQAHLTRAFKRLVRLTPGEYLRDTNVQDPLMRARLVYAT